MREMLLFSYKRICGDLFFNLFILKLKHEERLWPRGRIPVQRQCDLWDHSCLFTGSWVIKGMLFRILLLGSVCDISECSLVGHRGEHLSIYSFKDNLLFIHSMLLTCYIASAHGLMSCLL